MGFLTFSFHHARSVDEARFRAFIEQLPFEVFRVKGTVDFPNRTMLLNFVGGKAEWSVWNGSAGTRLAFVGWDVDGGGLLRTLEACVVGETPPRPPSETPRH
jgi:G3E family GTPase